MYIHTFYLYIYIYDVFMYVYIDIDTCSHPLPWSTQHICLHCNKRIPKIYVRCTTSLRETDIHVFIYITIFLYYFFLFSWLLLVVVVVISSIFVVIIFAMTTTIVIIILYTYTPRPRGLPGTESCNNQSIFCKLKQKRWNCTDKVEQGMSACKRTVPILGFIWDLHRT